MIYKALVVTTTAIVTVSGVWSGLARSADGDNSAGASDASQLDEVIVTARKRPESVLKVPVVESVLSAETLEQTHVTDIRGVSDQVPGLRLGGSVLTVGTQVALRGVGTSSLDAGVDQSVSLNIDGMQFSQGSTFNVGLFDMQQLEVLKGPQALFFGKNSPGGVISIRTADPGPKPEIIVNGSYEFEARERRGELILSGPVTDTLGVRLAGMVSGDDGYFYDDATALPGTGAKTPEHRYDINHDWILRGTVVWKPIGDFSARLKLNNSTAKVIGGGETLGSCPDGNGAVAPFPPFINPKDPCKFQRTFYLVDVDPAAFPGVANNGEPFLKTQSDFGTLEMTYDLAPSISLNSTTGYSRTKVDGFINGTDAGYAGTPLIADNDFLRHDFTQEVRLESDFQDSPLNFLAGGFYQKARMRNRVFVGGNTALGLPATLVAGINDIDIESYSFFGQGRWRPISKLEIALGARWTDEKRHDDAYSLASIDAAPVPTTIAKPDLHSDNWSPELSITYTPTDDLTAFFALKQGFKSGSYIITIPATPGQDNSFGDERVRGGEIGLKSRLLDRALSINAAFYDYKYKGLQVGANTVAQDGIPTIRTINAASAKVYGVDFDMTYRPPQIAHLSARAGVNWNHARFEDFENAQCSGGETIADGCNLLKNPATGLYNAQNLSGFPLPKAADWQVNGGIIYEVPLSHAMHLNLGPTGEYTTRYLTDLGNRSDYFQPAFFKIGANLTLQSDNEAWSVALIGNNLNNKFTSGNCVNFTAATGSVLLPPLTGAATRNAAGVDELGCTVDPGREIFLRLSWRPLAK
jgi:iron complex outermembrane recepter protein